jgi:hypothetical protein
VERANENKIDRDSKGRKRGAPESVIVFLTGAIFVIGVLFLTVVIVTLTRYNDAILLVTRGFSLSPSSTVGSGRS